MSDKPICLFCGEKQIMVSSERKGRGNSSYLMASASCGCCYATGPIVQSDYLPGLEPDFDVKKELRFTNGVLDLRQFDKIFISVSGGKDSHAMLFLVKELAEKQGVSDRLIAMYADTGMEWHNAESHVREICTAANVPLEVVYPVRPMLERFAFRISQVQKNGKDFVKVAFPSSACRYCTSGQKCSPMDNFMRKYTGKLLKVTGERWAESKARSNYAEFVKVDRISTKKVANMGGGSNLQMAASLRLATNAWIFDRGCISNGQRQRR